MQPSKEPNSASSRPLMILALVLDVSLFGQTASQKARTLKYDKSPIERWPSSALPGPLPGWP